MRGSYWTENIYESVKKAREEENESYTNDTSVLHVLLDFCVVVKVGDGRDVVHVFFGGSSGDGWEEELEEGGGEEKGVATESEGATR